MINDTDEQEKIARYLAANPAMTLRDFKGKGFSESNPFDKHREYPGDPHWSQLKTEDVRKAATTEKARFLSRGERQAAGRDPGLVWDERTGEYALREERAPHPQEPTGGNDREGAGKVPVGHPLQTGGCSDVNANHENGTEIPSRALTGRADEKFKSKATELEASDDTL